MLYEEALIGSGCFSYLPMEKMVLEQNNKPMITDEIIVENNLNACITVKTGMSAVTGWKKKVQVVSEWRVRGRDDWKVLIITKAISEKTYGMFPGPDNPELQPIFLELAKENVKQFLKQLVEMGVVLR